MTDKSPITFSDFSLADPIAQAVQTLGYKTPTPIQQQAIPKVMAGADLLGIAQTGTGKTAAFALPTLDFLARNPKDLPKRGCRVLVLSPTRELATQIAESFRLYGKYLKPYVTTVFGGVPVSRQVKACVGGNDIVVATPGRLLDLMDQNILRLSDVEVLILDEADQMMDMGFIKPLQQIVRKVPKQRQTLFFSATMPSTIARLSKDFLTDPQKVAITPESTTAERVQQSLTFVSKKEKQALLTLSLSDPSIDRALVFTRTKHGADRVVKQLSRAGLIALAIHGNKSQSQRQKALAAFKSGEVKFLIATDVAARGIDIDGVSHVFNFEIPNVPEQYVHRIGRTARAGRGGIARSFVDTEERPYLKSIHKILKMTIPVEPLPENFVAEVRRISNLPPPVLPPKPEQAKRSGRGKSRKKKRGDQARSEDGGEKRKKHRPGKRRSHDRRSEGDNNGERGRVTPKGSSQGPDGGAEQGSGGGQKRRKHRRGKGQASGGQSGGGEPAQAGGHKGGAQLKRRPRRSGSVRQKAPK